MINIDITNISELLEIDNNNILNNIFEDSLSKINSINLYVNQYYNLDKLYIIKDNTYIKHGFCYLIDYNSNKTYWMLLTKNCKFYNFDLDITNNNYNNNIFKLNNLDKNILDLINLYHILLKK